MARAVTLTSSQPLQRAQAVGRAVSDVFTSTAEGAVKGVELSQKSQEHEKRMEEWQMKIDKAKKSEKALNSIKEQTVNELSQVLKGKDFDYVDSRIKAVKNAQSIEDLSSIAQNIQSELQQEENYIKKYPNLKFGKASKISSAVLTDPKYGEGLLSNSQTMVDKTNAKNIEMRAREFAMNDENENLDMEDAWIKFHQQQNLPEGALRDPSIKSFFQMGWTSEGERLKGELAQAKEARQRKTEAGKMDDITNKSFVSLEKKANQLAGKILDETKVDIRNLTDPAQFIAGEEFKSLAEDRKKRLLDAIDKQKEYEIKKQLASAAAGLGIKGLTESKLDNIYKDATDTDGPTDSQTRSLWRAAGLSGMEEEEFVPEDSTLTPEQLEIKKKYSR